jgi:hypothetical protein
MNMYRQGDVLLIAVDDIDNTAPQKRDPEGRIVLAYGEVTGHAHAIHDKAATLYGTDLEERFLEVLRDSGVTLSHEEHAPIHLPHGAYRVVRQREWTTEGNRWLAD